MTSFAVTLPPLVFPLPSLLQTQFCRRRHFLQVVEVELHKRA